MIKSLRTLHLASFDGNIGDNANHFGFYKFLKKNKNFAFVIDPLEIREFYWKERFFDESFVELVNSYDLLIIGGGNYFELWVENSPTGTSIAIDLQLLKKITTPILFNALGVDPGQGASEENINKFRNFLDLLIIREDFISIRNDGAKKAIVDYVGEKYLEHIHITPDAGFFVEPGVTNNYYKNKKYIAINVAYDMQDVRFNEQTDRLSYQNFLKTFKKFTNSFLSTYQEFEIVFVPHIYSDVTFITDLLNILDDKTRRRRISIAPLAHGQTSLGEVTGIYAGAKGILGNRFHANVCGMGLGVPTIGLVNYRQIQELYNELENDNYVDITTAGFDKKLMALIASNMHTPAPSINKIESQYLLNMQKIGVWLNTKALF